MMRYSPRDLLIKRGSMLIKRDVSVNFLETWPTYMGGNKVGMTTEELYHLNVWRSYDDILEQFNKHAEQIARCCGQSVADMVEDEPTLYGFLHLADSVNSYMGLYD